MTCKHKNSHSYKSYFDSAYVARCFDCAAKAIIKTKEWQEDNKQPWEFGLYGPKSVVHGDRNEQPSSL